MSLSQFWQDRDRQVVLWLGFDKEQHFPDQKLIRQEELHCRFSLL